MNEFKLVVNERLPIYKNKNDVLCSLEDPATQVVFETRKIINIFNENNSTKINIRDIKRNFDKVLCKKTSDEKLKDILTFLSFFKEEVYIHIIFNEIRWIFEYNSLVDWNWLEEKNILIHDNDAENIITYISEFIETIISNIDKVLDLRNKELKVKESNKCVIDNSLVWYEKWKYEIYEKLLSLKENPDKLRKVLIIFYNRTITNDFYFRSKRTYKHSLVEDKEFIYFRNLIRYLYWNEEINNKEIFNDLIMFYRGHNDNIPDETLLLISAKMQTYSMNFEHLFNDDINNKS